MAAPHVAGVMALMRYVNPQLSPAQVDTLLDAGTITDELGPTGRDVDYGFGLINARKAVDAALAALNTPPVPAPARVVALPSTLDFGALQTSADRGAHCVRRQQRIRVRHAPGGGRAGTGCRRHRHGGQRRWPGPLHGQREPRRLQWLGQLLPRASHHAEQRPRHHRAAQHQQASCRQRLRARQLRPGVRAAHRPGHGPCRQHGDRHLANGRYSWSKTGYTRTASPSWPVATWTTTT
jgi:hypothetical protein